MKYFIVLIFCLYSVGAVSQARVGHHITQVINEFPASKVNDSVYIWRTDNAVVKYLTDPNGLVTETIIYPLTLKDEKIYTAYYNNSFIKRGSSMWVFVQGSDSCYVTKVRKGDLNSVYFIWSFDTGLRKSYE